MQSDSSPLNVNNDATNKKSDDLWARDLQNLESLFTNENRFNQNENSRDKSSTSDTATKNCLSPSNLFNDCTNKSTDNNSNERLNKSINKKSSSIRSKASTTSSSESLNKDDQLNDDEYEDQEFNDEYEESNSDLDESDDSDEDEEKQNDENKSKKSKTKKRKKKAQFERRNIKKLIQEKDLSEDVLMARKAEEERINRILEQQKQLKNERQKFDFPVSSNRNKLDEDIILSSDDDVEVIDSTEDDDIVISYERIQDEIDASNSGLHTDDTLNIPDCNGRVLVNIGHPSIDPDIFLDDFLAKKVKPHQIGGIRFMYDCVVENLTKVKNSDGIGGRFDFF